MAQNPCRAAHGPHICLLAALLAALLFAALPVAAQLRAADYWEPSPLPQTGLATFYAPGLMEDVTRYRLAQAEISLCPECVGAVALLRAGDIGRKVWLQPPEGGPVGPFLVVDCARQQDVAPLLARNWVVDVSYELGQLWAMARPLPGVTVLQDPADALPPAPAGPPTPFSVPPGQVIITAPTATPLAPLPQPTAWPTRLPQPLPGALLVSPLPLPVPAAGPPPLTPVVTTPTSQPSPETPAEAPAPTLTPAAPAASEASLGHAGALLIDPVATPVRQLPAWPTATVTPRAPARTPRPDLTPILPAPDARPAPVPTPSASLFARWWQDFIELIAPSD